MINISVQIKIPELWETAEFNKSEWGSINIVVGPNGTGKTLFAVELQKELKKSGYKTRMLNAERLSGFEKQGYSHFGTTRFAKGINIDEFDTLKKQGEEYGLSSSAFIILKENLDIRIKIEALLSDIFNKTIRLVEEGGFLKPKIQANSGGEEINLQEKECHGLKELITLLTFLYDKSNNCLILDEPELHLHPQFQSFLLSEIRKFAGDPNNDSSKKLFIIITHSPYFLDLRTLDDLKSILVCHYNKPLNFIDELDQQDEYILNKFLPRFNTHHKQFFFSPNPVFVEGYTDQQIITLLFDKLDYNISASGSSVIDVGGKDELAVFYKLCKKLKIKAKIIADLDALFKGKLREVAQNDENCNSYVQSKGLGTDLSALIGELERKIKEVADDLVTKTTTDTDIIHLIDFLNPIINIPDKRHKVVTSSLMSIIRFKPKIKAIVSDSQKDKISFIVARFKQLLKALKTADIFIFPKGEIEHYYTQTSLDYLNFSDNQKSTSFHTERDYILSCTSKIELETKYKELVVILKESVPQVKVDLSSHLRFQIIEWIQVVQRAISKGDINNLEGLKENAKIDYKLFNQILEASYLRVKKDKTFVCKIKINQSLVDTTKEIEFCETTIPHSFEFKI